METAGVRSSAALPASRRAVRWIAARLGIASRLKQFARSMSGIDRRTAGASGRKGGIEATGTRLRLGGRVVGGWFIDKLHV